MKNYIESFCKEFGFPDEAKEVLLNCYDAVRANPEAFSLFQEPVELYFGGQLTDYTRALGMMDKAAELAGVHRFTVHMLFYVCLSKHTRALYLKRGIPYSVYFDSMSDLKWKLFECKKVENIWGTASGWWAPRFFDLTRFALGRLQFETALAEMTYAKNGYTVNPDDTVLNIHIPSSGPLYHEECLASYRMAAEFYKDTFKDKPIVFKCSSWLLYPAHYEFLPKNSNILKFMDDFDIVSSYVDEKKGFLWRIFHTLNCDDLDALPCETSLQRAYIDWLKKGNPVGVGIGFFIYNQK